jgi:ABC-type lipoprotein export system ATPase subunit
MMDRITVLGGRDKTGNPEAVTRLDISAGQICSIVGFTGSGKSQLIGDIEQMAQGDTVTGRRVLIDGVPPDQAMRFDPELKLVAQLSQNMNFVLEMSVAEFIGLHAECRGISSGAASVHEVMEAANSLAGEPIRAGDTLTRLSGGQSRALMIADVACISDSPVILIDEVENAGIDRRQALRLLTGKGKIVLIVTHDPQLALLGERRIVMRNGGMSSVIDRSDAEVRTEKVLGAYMDIIAAARARIRSGECVEPGHLGVSVSDEMVMEAAV